MCYSSILKGLFEWAGNQTPGVYEGRIRLDELFLAFLDDEVDFGGFEIRYEGGPLGVFDAVDLSVSIWEFIGVRENRGGGGEIQAIEFVRFACLGHRDESS